VRNVPELKNCIKIGKIALKLEKLNAVLCWPNTLQYEGITVDVLDTWSVLHWQMCCSTVVQRHVVDVVHPYMASCKHHKIRIYSPLGWPPIPDNSKYAECFEDILVYQKWTYYVKTFKS